MQGAYRFHYLENYSKAQLDPLPGFPDLDEVYEAPDLFPYFEDRDP